MTVDDVGDLDEQIGPLVLIGHAPHDESAESGTQLNVIEIHGLVKILLHEVNIAHCRRIVPQVLQTLHEVFDTV